MLHKHRKVMLSSSSNVSGSEKNRFWCVCMGWLWAGCVARSQ